MENSDSQVFQQTRRINKPLLYGALVFLFLTILAVIILRPRVLALYHQVKGGVIVTKVMLTYLKSNPNALACELDPIEDNLARTQLQQAISHLEAARKHDPKLAQTYLLLGRAYCLMGEAENAISSYRAYLQLRPKNPLGHLEFGLAYTLIGQRMSVIDWQAAGISPEQILAQAEQEFGKKDYMIAANHYRLSSNIKELPFASYLRWVIAATISKQELPESALQRLPIFSIDDSENTKIEGEYFRWLRENEPYHLKYGDRLLDHPGADQTIGIMWWSGDAVAIIQTPISGNYTVTIRARNTFPPPIQMYLTVDQEPSFPFEMNLGDNSWQEFKTEVALDAGFHVIGFRYLNNGAVNGKDRDAVMDWIEFTKIDKD
jgi:tetratricopeptide (TPR) repeat protein